MATTLRKSSKTRPTAKSSKRRDSVTPSPSPRRWTPILWSRSIKTGKSPKSGQTESDNRRAVLGREIRGIVLLLFAVFLGGALAAEGFAQLEGTSGTTQSFGWMGGLLAVPVTAFFGWPASLLLPLAPAAHALRLFGRLGERKDRSWTVFLLGIVVLLPVIFGLAQGAPREADPLAGIWGSFAAFYLLQFAGPTGAWIVIALSLSALMAATLSWNPIRVMVGKRVVHLDGSAPTPAERRGLDPKLEIQVPPTTKISLVPRLEPSPEEMPAADLSLMDDASIEPNGEIGVPLTTSVEKKTGRKTRSTAAADHAEKIAAEIGAGEGEAVSFTDEDLPSPDLLAPPPPRNTDLGRRELDAMGVKLMEALRTFRVEGELVGRTTGPVVTQFEVAPAAGVKVRQIANLSNDLALAMRAASIRIVAPIPGRGAVGVEVPNPTPEMVGFRELVELSVYNTLPHLRHKVITDNRDAAAVLKWAVMEMQERYELLAANGCRNLQDFNRRVQDASPLKL